MLKVYLLSMWLSGSFCSLLIHSPEKSQCGLDIDLRLGSNHIERQEEKGNTIPAPWKDGRWEGIHNSRGEEESSWHESQENFVQSGRDGQLVNEGFNDFNPSKQSRNAEFLFEGSAPQTTSYLRKGKAQEEKFETPSRHDEGKGIFFTNLAHQLPEFQDSSVLERQLETKRLFEPEATRQSLLESRPTTNSITHTDIPTTTPIRVVPTLQLYEYKWLRDNFWLEPNIMYPDATLKAISIYSSLELVGMEILDKIKLIPTLQGYEHSVQMERIRASCPSHSIKTILTYIELLNNISEPKLYSTPQDLIDAQKDAVLFVEGFWTKFNEQKEQRTIMNENLSTDDSLFPSEVEKERFENIFKYYGFYYSSSNSIGEFLFLMWMKKNFPSIHEKMHAHGYTLKWKPSIISALHAMLLTLKSSEEIKEGLKFSSFTYTKYWTYRVKVPFKIDWNTTC